jgi:hypothetical protein
MDSIEGLMAGLGAFMFLLLILYFLPAIIAYWRRHEYRHVILALNIVAGWTGIAWIAAIIWAVWPREKSLADPVLGNVTGIGERNSGDTLGSVRYGQKRGYEEEAAQDVLRAVRERSCPHCAEMILGAARKCKHCRSDVEPLWVG